MCTIFPFDIPLRLFVVRLFHIALSSFDILNSVHLYSIMGFVRWQFDIEYVSYAQIGLKEAIWLRASDSINHYIIYILFQSLGTGVRSL